MEQIDDRDPDFKAQVAGSVAAGECFLHMSYLHMRLVSRGDRSQYVNLDTGELCSFDDTVPVEVVTVEAHIVDN